MGENFGHFEIQTIWKRISKISFANILKIRKSHLQTTDRKSSRCQLLRYQFKENVCINHKVIGALSTWNALLCYNKPLFVIFRLHHFNSNRSVWDYQKNCEQEWDGFPKKVVALTGCFNLSLKKSRKHIALSVFTSCRHGTEQLSCSSSSP